MEWRIVKECPLPEDGNFLCVIDSAAGEWVGMGCYSYHYDATNRMAGKYEFFYVTDFPENEGIQFRKEDTDKMAMITHWMPLPQPPK